MVFLPIEWDKQVTMHGTTKEYVQNWWEVDNNVS